MKIKTEKIYIIITMLVLIGTTGGDGICGDVDNSIFADLLDNYVTDGVVDYAGLKKDESRLDAYLRVLEGVGIGTIDRDAQFAFYINAYNAWTLKLILSGYPGIESIKDLGTVFKSPWKKEIVRIDGRLTTLDHVEHGILRPRFKDARVHFAINCASRGCPPLITEPYQGDILEQQLDAVTGAFLNDPEYNRLEGNILYVSRIFKWFKEDFNKDIVGFFLKYAKGTLEEGLEAGKGSIKIKYLDYDWSLNGT